MLKTRRAVENVNRFFEFVKAGDENVSRQPTHALVVLWLFSLSSPASKRCRGLHVYILILEALACRLNCFTKCEPFVCVALGSRTLAWSFRYSLRHGALSSPS